MMLPRVVGALSGAMQAGHKDFDLEALALLGKQAFENVMYGLPYMQGPGGEASAVKRDRDALIKRAKDRRDRLRKEIKEGIVAPPPMITPVAMSKKDVTRS